MKTPLSQRLIPVVHVTDFQTKYYEINEPGKLAWGLEGEVMKVEYSHVA